ncbi:MAG: RNase adapter RapZ [Lachnospiraceae bacterium]|nr:RNase adapter RapZ [Lachnospiraceae bacterium]
MRFVVVTGMSGGGKTTVLKMLEDIGFYCVDNLPVSLIEKFVELIATPNGEINKVALGVDVRTSKGFSQVPSILEGLKKSGYSVEILFLECGDQVLLKRYKESRRVHPLCPGGRVAEGIDKEREVLHEIKTEADYVIDTTNLLTRELKEEIGNIFVQNKEYNSLMISVMSFGFKNGIPADADLVFDVRFLPNPFYIDELKHKTGLDKEVQDYVMGFEEAETFLQKIVDLMQFLIPNYIKEGKNQLIVGIGCTGGKHRSVTLAGELYKRLKDQGGYGMKLYHRDVITGL